MIRSGVRMRTSWLLILALMLSACTFELQRVDDPAQEDTPEPVEDDASSTPSTNASSLTITWSEVEDALVSRFEGQSAVVDGLLYVFGGYTDGSIIPKSFEGEFYDPEADMWVALPFMPRPLTHAGTAVHESSIYFAGGVVGSENPDEEQKIPATDEVWRFDTHTWEWSAMPALPEPRGAGTLATMGDTLHFVGGTTEDRETALTDHFTLDLKNPTAWVEAPPMKAGRNHLASVVLDGKIYVVGGQTGHNETLTTQATVEVYDPEVGDWQEVAPLPHGLGHITNSTFAVGGKIVVVGGETSAYGSYTDEVWVYDPGTDRWTSSTPFPLEQASMMGGVVDETIYLMGGTARNTQTFSGSVTIPDLEGL